MIERRILKHATMIHYTSEQERTEAAELDVAGASAIIPNAFTPARPADAGQFRARYPELRDRKIILFMSRLDAKKGLDLLLPAFARVRQQIPEAALVLAGDGAPDFTGGLRETAARLGIDGHVLWAGFLTGQEKQAALADADLFVLPSYSENFGIAVAEAMAAGLPVVVSDQVAIHAEISSAGAGVVVPCDAGRLTEALIELLADEPTRSAMGRNGKCLAQKRYSLEAVTQQLVSLYNRIVQ